MSTSVDAVRLPPPLEPRRNPPMGANWQRGADPVPDGRSERKRDPTTPPRAWTRRPPGTHAPHLVSAHPAQRGSTLATLFGATLLTIGLLVAGSMLTQPSDHRAGPTPGVTSVVAARWRSVEETFDGLPTNSKLPEAWKVGGAGIAEIIALPTSIDRSARIASTINGEATSACRSAAVVPAGSIRVAVDLLLGRAPSSAVAVVTMESGSSSQLAFGVDPTGSPVEIIAGEAVRPAQASASAPNSAAPSTTRVVPMWQRLEVMIDPTSGAVQWQVRDTSGGQTGAGTTKIRDMTAAPLEICFLSPQGSPSGWTAIDDLVVEG